MLPVDTERHRETVAWLECSLDHARACGQTRTEELLESVRVEVEFEAEYARISRIARVLLHQQCIERQEANGEVQNIPSRRSGG